MPNQIPQTKNNTNQVTTPEALQNLSTEPGIAYIEI